jgi:hypothetical protein
MEQVYTLWETLKKKYPDSFVLLANPVYEQKYSPGIKEGIFIYKNKRRRKVIEKELIMNNLGITAIRYTGGKRLDAIDENMLVL